MKPRMLAILALAALAARAAGLSAQGLLRDLYEAAAANAEQRILDRISLEGLAASPPATAAAALDFSDLLRDPLVRAMADGVIQEEFARERARLLRRLAGAGRSGLKENEEDIFT